MVHFKCQNGFHRLYENTIIKIRYFLSNLRKKLKCYFEIIRKSILTFNEVKIRLGKTNRGYLIKGNRYLKIVNFHGKIIKIIL